MLTTMNDQHRTSDFVPLALLYWLTVQNSREDLVDQLAVGWPELCRGHPLVDDTLCRRVVTEVDPV